MPVPRLRVVLMLAALPAAASAADVQFEGSYRARGRIYDSLTLERTLGERAEGTASYFQHRLWLRPHFLLSDSVSVTVDFRGLDGVYWGQQPGTVDSFVDNGATAFEYELNAPTSSTDETAPLRDFTIWRAWGQVDTPIGTFKMGRMPLHWGTGIWLNDGVHTAPNFADYGDSADRFQWEYLVRDQFYLRLAADLNAEGYINDPGDKTDDYSAYNFAAAYRAEDLVAGLLLQVDRRPSLAFNMFTADASADADLGKLHVAAEVLGQFGGGDLPNGANDVSIMAFGTAIEANLNLEALQIDLHAGLATGDKDDTDNRLRTFTFDRDYSVGLMMFEQAMPVLTATVPNDVNGGRTYEAALTSNAISNALYLKPSVRRQLFLDGLDVEASVLWARVAQNPTRFIDRNTYGLELGAGLSYTGIEHVDASLQGAAFLPGTYYKNFVDDTFEEGFNSTAYGGQFTMRFHF